MRFIFWIIIIIQCPCFAQTPYNYIIGGAPHINGLNFFGNLTVNSLSNLAGSFIVTNAAIASKDSLTLFYSNGFTIWNSYGQKVTNADTLAPCNFTTTYYNTGNLMWQNAVFIPDPGDTNEFYLFYSSGDIDYWYPNGPYPCATNFYYAKINKNINGNSGLVTSKNVVIGTDTIGYSVCAIKHGNGRDWWIIKRHNHLNKFIRYLVSPSGVIGPVYQTIGTLNYAGFTNFKFAPFTNKVACYNAYHSNSLHHCDIYDFDRCSGLFTNPITLTFTDTNFWPNPGGCEFSPNGKYLYVSTMMKLRQFDVTLPNIAQSEVLINTVDFNTSPIAPTGVMQLGPNGKIYICINSTSTNYLHFINFPDSSGIACNFNFIGVYLPNFHTMDLPNIPAYELGPAWGSGCDTITSSPLSPEGGLAASLQSNYVSEWQKLFVNGQNIKGKQRTLCIFSVEGKLVYQNVSPPSGVIGLYFTQDVDVSNLSCGLYLISLTTEKESLNAKFVKE